MFSSIFERAKTCGFQLPLTKIYCKPVHKREIYAADSCEFGSNKFFVLCSIGGLLSCGSTHLLVVPLDLVKCRLQVDSTKYKSLINGLKISVIEEGILGLTKGWAPTLLGYSAQGLFKFGLYEYFKVFYANRIGEENAYLYRTYLFLVSSASAEFIADIALCPFEAIKVKMQTSPGFANSMREAYPKMLNDEGAGVFYKGLVPLWSRQIPYTMMKFACFERTVEIIYKNLVPKPRSECSKSEQLLVTFAAGYIAGIFCAVVSHPADVMVSKLNQAQGSSIGKIYNEIGFIGLWKGLVPRIIMIGTLTALQWFVYDGVKVILGIPRPPPPEMPESLKKN